ncbi:MAG TPA: acetyl-CoA carboxylase carboxyl transferase subunit beta [Rhodospirillaceae bacterium]|jgi:acetyl-CoA carboxylase carboxyl transferase subunit beta|nr:acetyl-CoA carboxylase carboxyltransferase subunit beta [Alphaproteobacteria bacterium]HBH26633.1 acetyl-CoA carboxylase carboxyl transferase subunit beta [Rhodospirillaceae bacterium]
MNWLTDFIRPRIRSFVAPKDVPGDLWSKCPACEGMLFAPDLKTSHNVCTHCGHHLRMPVKDRLALLFDGRCYKTIAPPSVPDDPLRFRDRRRYTERLREARAATGLRDAITIAHGTIGGRGVVAAAFHFSFMGGSMGVAVGQGFLKAAREAVARRAALLAIPCSGGARMQEGALSLMQMPRTVLAVEEVRAAGLPYIVLLTDPTTGGVTASFAMLGDIHIAEPGAMIGFAGQRVIAETIRETLPPGFQTAEYLRENGMVDMVVPRKEMAAMLGRVLGLVMPDAEAA